jgi:hypothetical protein
MHLGSGLFGWAVSGADAKNAISEVTESAPERQSQKTLQQVASLRMRPMWRYK